MTRYEWPMTKQHADFRAISDGPDFGAEPHGEDAAVMAEHEPSLGRFWPASRDKINEMARGRSRLEELGVSPDDIWLKQSADAPTGVRLSDLRKQADADLRSVLSEFCEAMGISEPADWRRACRAFAGLVERSWVSWR